MPTYLPLLHPVLLCGIEAVWWFLLFRSIIYHQGDNDGRIIGFPIEEKKKGELEGDPVHQMLVENRKAFEDLLLVKDESS